MKTTKIAFLFLGVFVILTIFGCQFPVIQSYPGRKLPNSKVAFIRYEWLNVMELTLDGEVVKEPKPRDPGFSTWLPPVGSYGIYDLAVLPGKHEITWKCTARNLNFYYQGEVALNLEAGVTYLITNQVKRGKLLQTIGNTHYYEAIWTTSLLRWDRKPLPTGTTITKKITLKPGGDLSGPYFIP